MLSVKHDEKQNLLIITIDTQSPKLSTSGKTRVVASTHGNQVTSVLIDGKPVRVGVNAYIEKWHDLKSESVAESDTLPISEVSVVRPGSRWLPTTVGVSIVSGYGADTSLTSDRGAYMERRIELSPAYDKVAEGYGIHCVELRMYLIGELGAIQFILYTQWYLSETQKRLDAKHETSHVLFCRPIPADIGYHSPKPQYEGQSKMSDECHILNGPCYYDGSGLQAINVFETLTREGSEGVWKEMEKRYIDTFEELRWDMPHQTFEQWMTEVDRVILRRLGLSSEDLPDYDYVAAYDDKLPASVVASRAIAASR